MSRQPSFSDFPANGGHMGERVRDHDWAGTPLGAIDAWTPALRMVVNLVLETRFPTIMAWGPDLTAIYNDAYRPLLGRKQALGRPFLKIWSEARDVIEPMLDRVWAGETSYYKNAPFTLMRHGYQEQARFDYCFSPLRDDTGAVAGLLNTAVETTETHHANQALRDSEERYRLLVEGIQEYGLFMMDRSGRITSWNTGAERLFGYGAKEVIGRSAALLFTPEDRAAGVPERELTTARATGQADDERWHVRRDGSRFWASGIMTVLTGPTGDDVQGFAKVMRDNTERRRTLEALHAQTARLESMNRNKTEFLGILGHELRNPLAAMSNALDVLALDGVPGDQRRESLDLIRRQAGHLRHLVDDLLNIVRIDQGQIQLRPAVLDLAQGVTEAVELVRGEMDNRRHHLILELPDDPLYLKADLERLKQVLGNLLNWTVPSSL